MQLVEVKKMENIGSKCFICGNSLCEEDSDHKRMDGAEFEELLKERAGYHPEIAHLKFKIRSAFQRLERKAGIPLQAYESELCLMVDKLHFWDLLRFEPSLKDIEAAIFGFMLPRSQVIRLVNLLKKEPDSSVSFPGFKRLLAEVHSFKKNARTIAQNEDYCQLTTTFSIIIGELESQFSLRDYAKFQRRRQAAPSAKNSSEDDGSDFILIEGIPFSTRRNSLDLSVLSVDDKSLMRYLAPLEKLKNLRELHLRNATLSAKGYRMLFNLLPSLETLDLSNSSSGQYCSFLGESLPNIRVIYLNETNLTDENLQLLTEKLPLLRVLYADRNRITDAAAEYLYRNKPSIVFTSLKGNPISQTLGLNLQTSMAFHGAYFQY